jgi:hypothetical protein
MDAALLAELVSRILKPLMSITPFLTMRPQSVPASLS